MQKEWIACTPTIMGQCLMYAEIYISLLLNIPTAGAQAFFMDHIQVEQ
jgi:hypothetical protein